MKEIETKAAFDKAIASPNGTVVDFYADWCGPVRNFNQNI